MFSWVVGALGQLDLLKTLSEGPGPDTPQISPVWSQVLPYMLCIW